SVVVRGVIVLAFAALGLAASTARGQEPPGSPATATPAPVPAPGEPSPATTREPATPPAEPAPPPSGAPVNPVKPPGFPKMVLLDVRHVMLEPFHWEGRQWLLFGGYTAAIAAASPADHTLSDRARASDYSLGTFGDTMEGLGDARSFVLLAGFYGAGLIGHDSKAKEVCLDGLASSLIASVLITPVISTVVGRERPTAEEGAYSFRPFNGRSFPSGHATQVFAVVSVIATHYDQLWVKALAYTAGLAGTWPRIRRGKHFPTDVLAGAIIGTAVGRSVVHYNDKLRSGQEEATRHRDEGVRLTIFPVVQDGGAGLAGTLRF
ncbi:MAG: phosphatase PAP2 family protein, partial [Acidobacteriota bacterium]